MSGQKEDNSVAWAVLLVMLGIVIYIFWYVFSTEIRDIIRWIRYGEAWLISWFIWDEDYTVTYNGTEVSWIQGFRDMPRWNAETLKYAHLSYFTSLTMQPLKLVFTGIFALMTIWCFFRGPRSHNRKHLGLDGLIERQSHNFPVIAPFVKFNPSKMPPRPPGAPVPAKLPLFAEALGPEEWLAYNQIPIPDGKLNQTATFKAFRKQLGPRWRGTKYLEPYQKILLASFCLKASRKRSESDNMLSRLAKCWDYQKGLQLSHDRNLLRESQKILKTKSLSQKTLEAANRHAFVTTAFLGALKFARSEGGVLAPAQFVWLRGHNRALWYPLNNLGRHSFHMEALGAMSHYRAERMTQRPIPVPQMDNALETITGYMKSAKARPIPELDYGSSNKRGIKKAV